VCFQYSELTFCESAQTGQTSCHDVRRTEYGEESAVCIYIRCAFLFSLKYIDLDVKHYFTVQAFVYKDILSLDRQYAEIYLGIIVLNCNCVTVAVYCVIALLLIGNCTEDRILFNAWYCQHRSLQDFKFKMRI
jgi:hypothetical protein